MLGSARAGERLCPGPQMCVSSVLGQTRAPALGACDRISPVAAARRCSLGPGPGPACRYPGRYAQEQVCALTGLRAVGSVCIPSV